MKNLICLILIIFESSISHSIAQDKKKSPDEAIIFWDNKEDSLNALNDGYRYAFGYGIGTLTDARERAIFNTAIKFVGDMARVVIQQQVGTNVYMQNKSNQMITGIADMTTEMKSDFIEYPNSNKGVWVTIRRMEVDRFKKNSEEINNKYINTQNAFHEYEDSDIKIIYNALEKKNTWFYNDVIMDSIIIEVSTVKDGKRVKFADCPIQLKMDYPILKCNQVSNKGFREVTVNTNTAGQVVCYFHDKMIAIGEPVIIEACIDHLALGMDKSMTEFLYSGYNFDKKITNSFYSYFLKHFSRDYSIELDGKKDNIIEIDPKNDDMQIFCQIKSKGDAKNIKYFSILEIDNGKIWVVQSNFTHVFENIEYSLNWQEGETRQRDLIFILHLEYLNLKQSGFLEFETVEKAIGESAIEVLWKCIKII